MKRLTVITTFLSLLSVWVLLLPLWFFFHQFPPEKAIKSYERFGAKLPPASSILFHNFTMSNFVVGAIILTAITITLGVRAQKNPRLFAGQTGITACWCSVLALTLFLFFLPLFKMGEVVGGGYHRATSEFTHIEFIVDSLSPDAPQIFMQRTGEEEVAIPKPKEERWTNVFDAPGTNKAFLFTFRQSPEPTNAPPDRMNGWWPNRVIELTLPLTNQPLSNYTVRTLWTCKTKADAVKGDLITYSINPSWDGKYLTVSSRIYGTSTNVETYKMTTYIFDVEQSKPLNPPSSAEYEPPKPVVTLGPHRYAVPPVPPTAPQPK